MLDFTSGYPIQTRQPSPGQLNPIDLQPIQVRGFGTLGAGISNIVGEDTVSVPSMRNLFSDGLWGYNDIRKVETNAEHQDLMHLLTVMDGGKEDAATALGVAFEPTRWMVIRQLLGKGPLQKMDYADSEIKPEILAKDAERLNELAAKEDSNAIAASAPDQLTPDQQEIRRLTDKLAYAKAVNNADKKLGFSWWDWLGASNPIGLFSLFGADSAKLGNDDVIRTLSRYDPNFKPENLWETIPPVAKQGLLENGIDESMIADSPNEEHAKYRLSQALIRSNTQKRLGTYQPTSWDWLKNTGAGFVDFATNTPTGAALLGIGAVEAAAGLLVTLAPEGLLIAGTEATSLGTALNISRNTAQVLYKLPLGMVPEFMEGATLLSRVPAFFGSMGLMGGLSSYSRQAHDIAFASATMYANPTAKQEIDKSEIALEGFYAGLEGALVFGVGFGLLGSTWGALKNRTKGVLIDAATGERNPFDKRFTFEETPLGNTIDLFTKSNKDLSVLERSPANKLKTEAILEKKDVLPEDLSRESAAVAERAETGRATDTPESAEATPEDVGTRKYETETTKQYIDRMAPNRKIGNIREFVTEVARRDPADTRVTSQLEPTQEFASMSLQDQIRVLVKSKDDLDYARKTEESTVGLPSERERLYDNMESQRKEWLRRLGKQLTRDEFQQIKKEILGEKTKKSNLPELLRQANDKAVPLKDRKAAASEATASILEAARTAAKSPEMAKIIKKTVPKEVLDSIDTAIAEEKITGITEGTADAIRKSILSPETSKFESPLTRQINNAIRVSKISQDRIEKIRMIRESHTAFLSVVKGNKENARRFYDIVNQGVRDNVLTDDDRVLLLASVVHLNFDQKGFNIKYEYADMKDVNVAGQYNQNSKTLTINTKATASKRVNTFLHELGHALFANDASGQVYLENLRLYNHLRDNATTRLKDPLTDNLGRYHLQNAEETFVQLFSNVLLAEAQKAMTPVETTIVRHAFKTVSDTLTRVAIALDESKYYDRVNEVIKALTDVDSSVVNKHASVSSIVKAFAAAEKEKTVEGFNQSLYSFLKGRHPELSQDAIPRLTAGEHSFLFKKSGDSTALIAFAIARETGKPLVSDNGRFTEHTTRFIDAYSEYKKAQYNSVSTKVAGILNSMDYKALIGMTKEERENFLMYEVFDINVDGMDKDAKVKEILATTYEDEAVAGMSLNDGNYATDYLTTTASNLVDMLSDNQLEVSPKNPNVAKNKLAAKVETRELSQDEIDSLIDRIEADPFMSKPIIEQVRTHFNKVGLENLLESSWAKMQKALILRLQQEGVFSPEDLKAVVESDNFKNWFGNSKVVDNQVKPLIVYHGSSDSNPISIFKLDQHVDRDSARKAGLVSYLGRVFYFSKNVKDASDFALYERSGENASVYPVYLRIEKPFDTSVEFSHTDAKKLLVGFYEQLLKETPNNASLENTLKFLKITRLESTLGKDLYKQMADIGGHADKANAYLQTLGYDGIIDNSSDMGIQYAVFKPEQIKSIWNSGEFNPLSNDIRRSVEPNFNNKKTLMPVLVSFLNDREALKKVDLESLLRDQFKFDDSVIQRVMKISGGNSTKALQSLVRAVREDILVHDGTKWVYEVRLPEETPEVVLPNEKVIEKRMAGSDLVTTDTVTAHLIKLGNSFEKQSLSGRISAETLDAAQEKLTAFLTPDSPERIKLLEQVEKGITPAQLKAYINRAINNAEISAARKKQKGKVVYKVDENGNKVRVVERENIGSTDVEGAAEGGKAVVADRTKLRDVRAEAFAQWKTMLEGVKERTGVDLLGPEETQLINLLNESRTITHADGTEEVAPLTYEDIAKRLGEKRKQNIYYKVTKLKTQLGKALGLTKEETKKWLVDGEEISKEERELLAQRIADVIEKLETTAKKETEPEPTPVEPEKAADVGNDILQDQVIENKLSTPAEPVPVPASESTEGSAVVITPHVNEEPQPVVRTAEAADSLVSGEERMEKTAVNLEIKKTLSMKGIFTRSADAFDRLFDALSIEYPDETAGIKPTERHNFVINLLKEKGYDSLMDERGNTIPLVPIKVVGKVKKNTTKKVSKKTKEKTTITTEENKTPVVITETVEASPVAPVGVVEAKDASVPDVAVPVESKPSEVAQISDEAKLERQVNDDPKTLRYNGLDTRFLRIFTKEYWKSKIESGKRTAMTPNFRSAFGDFVLVNNFIAEANRTVFGENAMERFWKLVDKYVAESAAAKALGEAAQSYRQILDRAAAEMAEEGKPAFLRPMLPEELKFIKDNDSGAVRLSAKTKKNRAIIEEAMKDADKPKPPPVEPSAEPIADAPVAEETEKPEEPLSNNELIDNAFDKPEATTSKLWRFNNWAGLLFGGDDTASASWWRKQMLNLGNKIQNGSKLGQTIRNTFSELAFMARFADDSRAQTAHVVAQGTKPFKTMLQCKMEEGMRITRIWRAQSQFMRNLKNADIPAINEYMYDCLYKGEAPKKAELLSRGVSPRVVDQAIKDGIYMLDVARSINERMLYMEAETGRLISVDKNGAPLDPNKYAPVQLDHEGLRMLSPADHPKVIQAMVEARRKRKLADPTLDKNTMIVLGWLDVKWNDKTKSYDFYSKERILKSSEAVNMFGNDTLPKLRRGSDGKLLPEIAKNSISGNKRTILNLLKKAGEDNFFVIETDSHYVMYRVPELLADLGPTDAAKYKDAINGNTAMYSPVWRERLGGKDLIQREMEEMFAFKTKSAPYGKENYGLTRPMFKIDPEGKVGITVPGLTPEEMMSDPLLKGLLRTNLAEAYFHWLKGRYFDLSVQSELDRMVGSTGITWEMMADRAHVRAHNTAYKMAKEAGWTARELDKAKQDITAGINRLKDEYRLGAETLPFLSEESTTGARAMSAALRYKFAAGYGVSQFTEMLLELTKDAPQFWRIPANVWTALRYVLGDYRFSKNRLLMSELGDMTFALESLKTDHTNRFLGEFGYGSMTMDSTMRTGIARAAQRFRDAHGFGQTLVSGMEAGADAMTALGSLGAQTQATRVLGKVRLQRQVWSYINKGSVEKLLENLAKPENAEVLRMLQKAASTDQKMQTPLWKKWTGIARESGFGFDKHDAMMFLKYGFTDVESVRLLKWAMEKVGHESGRVNMHKLWDLVDKVRREGANGIDADALDRTVSNYQRMLQERITKEVATEPMGLNRMTGIDTRTASGRLWYALTSFIRSFHDNVIMNYGSKNTMKFMLGGLFLYGVYDAFISLFKEYLAGRKADDIKQEMQDHPSEFFLRGAARTPFFGVYSGFLEAGLSAASAMNGGTYKFYGVPGLPGGATAGVSALSDMYNSGKKIFTEDKTENKIKAASGLLGFTDIVNRSHAAIPIRLLEDAGAVEQQSAIETYMDLVHRNPYPYKKITQSNVPSLDLGGYKPEPRNYALESQQYLQGLKNSPPMQKIRPVPQGLTSPIEGVSGQLGDLLDSAQ